MNNEDKLFDFMTMMYNEMQNGFKKVDDRFNRIESDMENIKADLKETKERVIHIEDDHGKKLIALFDGYKQNSDKLDRIEKEVSKHDEFIIRRVK